MILKTKVACGALRGCANEAQDVAIYKGIPYATVKRFMPPCPVEPWEGEKICDSYGAISLQRQSSEGFYGKEFYPVSMPVSEQCLFLNIWTPAKSIVDKLPVMFWIHGGGLVAGYGHEMEFDGEELAKRGVILVTINYRLGFFGCFAHKELLDEKGKPVMGNNAVRDQIAALEWVKENIGSFGGDPDNVTIFGQSAGGGSVCSLLSTWKAKGLFKRAIIQSGFGGIKTAERSAKLADAYEWSEAFLEHVGKNLDEIMEMPAMELLELYSQNMFTFPMMPQILVENELFDEAPIITVMKGIHEYDLMVGSVNGDGKGPRLHLPGVSDQERVIYENWGPLRARKFVEKYPYKDNPELYKAFQDSVVYSNELCFGAAQIKYAPENPAYIYHFDAIIPGHNEFEGIEDDIAFHSSELWFVFGTLGRCWRPFNEKHYALSGIMLDYWSNFAKTGNPNGTGVPEWKIFDEENGLCMNYMSEDRIKMESPVTENIWKVVSFF